MAAVPRIEDGAATDGSRPVMRVEGDLPSPANPPAGCHFHPRCSKVMPVCMQRYPEKRELAPGHWTRCHLYDE
jgi:peptide/nickel transport system ATP-binding protein